MYNKILLLIWFNIFGTLFLYLSNIDNVFTFILFYTVASAGFILAERLSVSSKLNFKLFSILWLVKLTLTLLLLKFGWIPDLNEATNSNWGFDPQRYYVQANDLVENNWIFIGGLNYIGILYYYGLIFYLFGHNPFAPALINSFFSFLAILFLIKYIIENVPHIRKEDSSLVLLILIPETVWYDIMTAREGILQALLILSIVIYYNKTIFGSIFFSKLIRLIVLFLLVLSIGFIRTSMVLPLILIFLYFEFFSFKESRLKEVFKLIGLFIFLSFLFNTINNSLSLSSFTLGESLSTISNYENNVAFTGVDYSNNSFSRLLFPSNWVQAVLFTPIRSILYLLAPLPNIGISFKGLLNGDSFSYNNMLVIPSSVLYFIYIPSILAFTYSAIRIKRFRKYLFLLFPFWIIFISITGGNLIIHERYRVMVSFLLVSSGIISSSRVPRQLLKKYKLYFYILMALFFFIYLMYKVLNA